jgi:hypothetical protein
MPFDHQKSDKLLMLVSRSRTAVSLCIALAFGVAGAGALLQSGYPVSDSAAFEYIGRAMIRGHALYRDVWDNKPPGIYIMNALWQKLFGEAYRWHAIAEAAIALVSAGLLVAVMRRFGVKGWAYALVAQTVLLTLVGFLNATEAYALPLILGSILSVANGRHAIGGALVGFGCLFWIPAGLMIVPLFALCNMSTRLRLGGGFCMVLVISIIAFVAIVGGENMVQLPLSWVSYVTTPTTSSYFHLHSALINYLPAPLFNLYKGAVDSGTAALLAVLISVIHKPQSDAQRFGLLWSAAMIAAAFAGTRFYSHYFIPASAALLFTICSYSFGQKPRLRMVIFLLVATGFAAAAVRNTRVGMIDRSTRSTNVVRVGSVIRSRLSAPTMSADGYEPGLYLAIDPMLRNPYEMVAYASSFMLRLAGGSRPADVTVNTGSTGKSPGRLVCAEKTAPWRIYAAPAVACHFRECP